MGLNLNITVIIKSFFPFCFLFLETWPFPTNLQDIPINMNNTKACPLCGRLGWGRALTRAESVYCFAYNPKLRSKDIELDEWSGLQASSVKGQVGNILLLPAVCSFSQLLLSGLEACVQPHVIHKWMGMTVLQWNYLHKQVSGRLQPMGYCMLGYCGQCLDWKTKLGQVGAAVWGHVHADD